jgi:hypothetical protein
MKVRPTFAFLLAIALIAGGCVGAEPLGKDTVIQKATKPEDRRPFWQRLIFSIRPDIKLSDPNYLGLKGHAKF